MDKLQLQKLRDLPIEGVAERLGLKVNFQTHKCLCPFHNDHHASMSFHRGRNTYRCFVCGEHGGTIDLVMRHLRLDFKAACRWLADENNIILEEWKPTSTLGNKRGAFDASRYARFFEHPWLTDEARRFLFDERKLDARVISWCRVSSWRDREGTNWLQIPYYDVDGKLIGIQNRNLIPSKSPFKGDLEGPPRFKFPYGSQCGIYNLPVLKLLRPGDELWITEGCSDCWAMLSTGRKAIAIPSATLLKPQDVEVIRKHVGEGRGVSLHMYPDHDAPGERLFLELRNLLPDLVHHQLPVGCKDFSEYYVRGR